MLPAPYCFRCMFLIGLAVAFWILNKSAFLGALGKSPLRDLLCSGMAAWGGTLLR